MLIVNGLREPYEEKISVAQYLETKDYRTDRVAVELNGEILPRSMYRETILNDCDKLEVVSFVGGG